MEKKCIYLLCVLIICSLICILPVAAGDTTPPAVISVDPVNGATGVLGNPTIKVTFNEWISDDSSDPLTGSITVNDGTNNIDFDYAWAYANELTLGNSPGPWLAPDTVYTVTIADFQDLAGNPMTPPYSWTFTTGADTTPPTVVSSNPADGAHLVPLELGQITVQFDEPIQWDPASMSVKVSMISNNVWEDLPTGLISTNGDTLVISAPNPPNPWFENWVSICVQVMNVRDTAGNVMEPGSYYYYFKTVSTDTTPPTVLSTNPVNGATNVPLDVTIHATMDQEINRCIGTVELVDHNGNLIESSHTWDAPDYIHLEFQPVSSLIDGETYTVTLHGQVDFHYNVMPDYSWSFSTPPLDTDNDGIPDGQEQGPGGINPSYDGNGDGIPDSQQGNVASFTTKTDAYITLSSLGGTNLIDVQAIDNPSPADTPAGVQWPFGFINFTITGVSPGGPATVQLYLPTGTTVNTYYKYGKTPGNAISHWYEFLYDGTTGAQINGNTITLHFVDGSRGDNDITANGLIIDPSSPGTLPRANVAVNIVPRTINSGSKGYFLAFVTLPDAYKGATIDMKTVSCSGAPAERMMKLKIFPRIVGFVFKTSELKDVPLSKKVSLTVQGQLKNKGITYTFSGSDTVNVISKPSWQPDDIKDVSKVSDDQLFKKIST